MVRYIIREYIHKILLSGRFLAVSAMILIALVGLFWNMTGVMGELGEKVGPFELLPCFLYVDTGKVIYFGILIFLVAVLPQWDGSLNQISRLGKKKWIAIQYGYVLLTSIVYYLIWALGFLLAFLPRLSWGGGWSSMVKRAADPLYGVQFHMEMKFNVLMIFDKKLISVGSPEKVWLLTFLLHVLAGLFLGMLMVTFNICFRRGTGTVIAYMMVGLNTFFSWLPTFLNNHWFHFHGYKQVMRFLMRMEFYASPLYQSDLFVMALHDARPLGERVCIGVTYFLLLIVLIAVFGLRMVRRIDLCQE